MDIENKLEKLKEKLEKAKKNVRQWPIKQPPQKPKPSTPDWSEINMPQDHPPKISEKEAVRLVKKDMELCKFNDRGQWSLDKVSHNKTDKE